MPPPWAAGNSGHIGEHNRIAGRSVDIERFGAVSGGSLAVNNAAFQSALDAAEAQEARTIFFNGEYDVDADFQTDAEGVSFIGVGKGRPGEGSSRINYKGSGTLFTFGSDNGLPHDTGLYDGPFNHAFIDLNINFDGASTTALLNGEGNYGTGTTAIKDWRGGDIRLQDVQIEGFEQGFWGIQSDFNTWINAEFRRCHIGAYLGPRTDQFTGISIRGLYCDTLLDLDRCTGSTFIGLKAPFCGSATTPPVRIQRSIGTVGTTSITFQDPWLENGGTYPSVNSFFEIGVGESGALHEEIRINNATVIAPAYTGAADGEVRYLCQIENATGVTILWPGAYGYLNVNRLVEFVGNVNSRVHVKVRGQDAEAGYTNSGTGTPAYSIERYDAVNTLGATIFEPLLVARRGGSSGFVGTWNARTAAVVENSLSSGTALSIMAKNTGTSDLNLGDQDGEQRGIVRYDHTDDSMRIFTNGTERMRLTSAGIVVLGAGGTGPQILFGTGTPEAVVTAPRASTFARTDGGVGTCYYVKQTATGNTGWVAIA